MDRAFFDFFSNIRDFYLALAPWGGGRELRSSFFLLSAFLDQFRLACSCFLDNQIILDGVSMG